MNKNNKSKYLISAILLLASSALFAQTEVKKETNEKELAVSLDEVVVTGTGTEHNLKSAPVQTEIISRKTLDTYTGKSLQDILSGLSASFDFNETDMGSNLQLNGLGNSYVLILVDGKKMHGDVGGQNALGMIDPNNIDHIEVVKGASSALYGSDAIAGVINIIMKKHTDQGLLVENTTRGGSNGEVQQHDLINYRHGKWNSATHFQLKHSDGWQNTKEEDPDQTEFHIYDSANRTVSRNTDWMVGEQLTYKPTNTLELYADGSFYRKRIYRPSGKYASVDVKLYDLAYKNASATTGAKLNLKHYNYITFDIGYNMHQYSYDYTSLTFEDIPGQSMPYPYYPGDNALQSDQRRVLSNLKGVFHLPFENTLSVGSEWDYEWLKAPSRLATQSHVTDQTGAVYVQDEWNPLERLNFTAGMRFVDNESFGFRFTPKVSTLYKVGNVNLRATYSSGFKTPTLKELHYCYVRDMSGVYLYLGNKDLKPQYSNYYSFGAEYNNDKFSVSASGYYNSVDNMIALTTIPSTDYNKLNSFSQEKIVSYDPVKVRMYQNMEDAKTFGSDFEFRYILSPVLRFGGSYSYLDTRSHVLEDDRYGNQYLKLIKIDGMSHHRGTVYGSWKHPFSKRYVMDISLYGRAQSKRYFQINGNGKAYQTWRFNTTHHITGNSRMDYELNAGIDNIFNYCETTPHGLNYGTTTPGRTFYVSFMIRFKQGKASNNNRTFKTNDEDEKD